MIDPAQILVLNGPNLNMLGTRQPDVYGADTLEHVDQRCRDIGAELGVTVGCFQTNYEGEMLDCIHQAARHRVAWGLVGVVINPGGWTHTSVALRDALMIPEVPIVEVHISNVFARERFRHRSYVSGVAEAVISGCGVQGYEFAIRRLARLGSVGEL